MLICAGLAFIIFAVFGQSIHHEFCNIDDAENIMAEPAVNSGLTMHGVQWAFTHAKGFRWTPLTTLSREADCQLFGLWPGGHHLTNLL
ncbi:MAG: hypothetical protein WCG14_08200, partial [Chlamydiia bacterium]